MIEHRIRKARWLVRGFLLGLYLRLHGCQVGRDLKCKQWPQFRQIPSCNLTLGNSVTIGHRVTIDVGKGAMLSLGDHVNLTQDLVICCGSKVSIGSYSGIAEFCSIRDGEHGYNKTDKIHAQQVTFKPIHIGDDVQISKGCLVLPGSIIANGAIVGAHSIVTSGTVIKPFGIYIGYPAKYVGSRL